MNNERGMMNQEASALCRSSFIIISEAGGRSIRMLLKIPKKNPSGKGASIIDHVTPKPADRPMNFLFFLYETSRPEVYLDKLSKSQAYGIYHCQDLYLKSQAGTKNGSRHP